METKHNKATSQRPTGDRAIEADQIFVNLDDQAYLLRQETAYINTGINAITVFKNELITETVIAIAPQKSLSPGAAELYTTFIFRVIKGSVKVSAFNEQQTILENQIIVINHPKSFEIEALEESICLLSTTSWR